MLTTEFILKELQKSGSVNLKTGNAVVKCPFHDQHNTIGTLSVSLGQKVKHGVWNCWSCKASGTWNALANKLGLRLDTDENIDQNYSVNTIVKCPIYEEPDESMLELVKLPKDFKWKRYDRAFLRKMKAKLLWNETVKDYYLYLPITYVYEYLGYVRCKIDATSYGPKYWFSVKNKIPYPSDYLIDQDCSTVVIVEGVSDAFRLIKNGIPAIALLGSFLTKSMIDVIESLSIEKAILCMDGDEAGRNAVFGKKGIANILDNLGIETRVLFPPEDKDPDNMPLSYIHVLKSMIKRMKNGRF